MTAECRATVGMRTLTPGGTHSFQKNLPVNLNLSDWRKNGPNTQTDYSSSKLTAKSFFYQNLRDKHLKRKAFYWRVLSVTCKYRYSWLFLKRCRFVSLHWHKIDYFLWDMVVSTFISSGKFSYSAAVSLSSWLIFTLTVMDANRPPFFFCNLPPHTDLSTLSGSWSVISQPSVVLICLLSPAFTVCCFLFNPLCVMSGVHLACSLLYSDSFILFITAVYNLSLLCLFITCSLCPFLLRGFRFWAVFLVSWTDVGSPHRAIHIFGW